MTMKMKEESPPDIIGSSPSPFRSLSLVFKGFCDPDDVEEDDDDDAYLSKAVEQKSNSNGSAISRNAVIDKVKETERNAIRSSRRVIIPEAASMKVAQKGISVNQSREIPIVKSEPKGTHLFKSTDADKRSLPITTESPKRTTATPENVKNPDPLTNRTNGATKNGDTARGETNDYRARNHAKGEETGLSEEVNSRGLDKPEGILLATEKRATKVLLEPTEKEPAARRVETLIFIIFCIAITLVSLQILGVETDFKMKPVVSDTASSSPISVDIRKGKVIEAVQAEDAVKEGLETSQDGKLIEEENEPNIEQGAESMNAEPITSNDEEKSMNELNSEEQDESEPINDHQESKEEKEDYTEIIDNESASDDSEESGAFNEDLEPADKRYINRVTDTKQGDEKETFDRGNKLNDNQQLEDLESMKEYISEEQDESEAINDGQESNGAEDPAEIIDNESVSDDSDELGSVNESMDGKEIHESKSTEAESISSLKEQEDESIRVNRDTDNDSDVVDEL